MSNILVIEDEPALASLIKDYLLASGYSVQIFANGHEGFAWQQQNTCDLVVLDIMLPGMDGISICKKIRETSQVPIIMATAKVEEIDRLLGLELGADDYICKPYSPRELVARVKAVLRRTQGEATLSEAVSIDPERCCATLDGTLVNLTAIELRLFEMLKNAPGKIYSRQQLMDNIYSDYRIVSDRTVDSHIKKLRKKLHEAAPHLELIHSTYGVGYKYEYKNDND